MSEANERNEDDDEALELRDLGEAKVETRQIFQFPRYPDNEFGFGWGPN